MLRCDPRAWRVKAKLKRLPEKGGVDARKKGCQAEKKRVESYVRKYRVSVYSLLIYSFLQREKKNFCSDRGPFSFSIVETQP